MAEQQPRYWLHHVAFCRHHEFDHKTDLEPQFKEAFEVYGQDFMQIRGSASTILDLFRVSKGFLGCPYGNVLDDISLSSGKRHCND